MRCSRAASHPADQPIMGVITAVLTLVAAFLAAISAYLTVLGIAAFAAHGVAPSTGSRNRRFAILVPAHNEAAVIGRLLTGLRRQRYPAARFTVFVVADNCTDETAEVARRSGATVHERNQPALRAKGHALRWLLERVRTDGTHDAYVILDADSEVDPDLLDRMDARLATGALALQSHYRVLNPDASYLTALREAAFGSLHYLRPLGRAALGLSCGLKGNGMCFDARMLDAHGWRSFGLAEDVELHLSLVRSGVKVTFVPEATVRADMPATLRGSSSQHFRWEAGRISALRQLVFPLLLDGIRQRSAVMLDAAVEQLIPPLSTAVAVAVGSVGAGLALRAPAVTVTAAVAAAGLAAHVIAGLVAVQAPPRTYRALLMAPLYVAWKVSVYGRAAIAPSGQPWVRTARAENGASDRATS